MYKITSCGELIAICEKPRYIKINPVTGIKVEATPEDAQGIAAGGVAYNLPGSTAIPDAPEAEVSESDISEFVFQNHVRIRENEATTGSAIIEMENALCESDAAMDERLTAVEDALCELDAKSSANN